MECPRCGVYVVATNPKCWNCGFDRDQDGPEPKVEKRARTQPIHGTTWFVWLTLVTVFPVGLWLMWKHKKHSLRLRVVLTGLPFLLFAGYLGLSQHALYVREAAAAHVKSRIEFRDISVHDDAGLGMVQGEVINHDDQTHSFELNVSFYDREKHLRCKAAGIVMGLQPNSERTFQAVSRKWPGEEVYPRVRIDTVIN
ncbi:hypothetical protein CEB3_c31180 [Peptococcaceae bacterium CEB3]|nr:hypothetical protein CEB3_c31180 [Peptococcaceae bacterium CEB3]